MLNALLVKSFGVEMQPHSPFQNFSHKGSTDFRLVTGHE
jgi:hypothetical protein